MSKVIIGQDVLLNELGRILDIFTVSKCEVRPHFILTGASGSGKTLLINTLAEERSVGFFEINAAQLTKEGTSGNSLSKALSPLLQQAGKPCICFVDEFDKLFISGNSNDSIAHESTTGVQNEFLKVLESATCSVFGDYGKYINVSSSNVLFVFAGAFNNEPDISIDRLREMGVKTEFLGRVGLVYNTRTLTMEELFTIVDNSDLINKYCALFENIDKETVQHTIKGHVQKTYENNTLGARLINTLVHQYFIKGGIVEEKQVEDVSFQKKLTL